MIMGDTCTRACSFCNVRTGMPAALDADEPRRVGETVNMKLGTGAVEVCPSRCEVLNESLTPPFYINEPVDVDGQLRLKHRYLDLRRPEVAEVIRLRHEVVRYMRNFLSDRGFIEVETPTLIK